MTPFPLKEYNRVVQLSSDILVMKTMDELMDIELHPADSDGHGKKVFAARSVCVSNPLKKPQYPTDW